MFISQSNEHCYFCVGSKLSAKYACETFRATICPPCYQCDSEKDIVFCPIKCSAKDNKFCVVKGNSDSSEAWKTECRLDFI